MTEIQKLAQTPYPWLGNRETSAIILNTSIQIERNFYKYPFKPSKEVKRFGS